MVFTCSYASISQVWGDCDPPAFIDTHALKTTVHPCNEFTQADLADEGSASVVAADSEAEVNKSGSLVKTGFKLKLNIVLQAGDIT